MTDLNLDKPKIVFNALAWQKMRYWITESNSEVSGLGFIEYLEDTNCYYVSDVILLKQKNSAASTDIDADEYGKILFQNKDNPIEIKLWWHSHNNMNVFWSGTDEKTIKDLAAGGWFIACVANKQNNIQSCVYQNKPIRIFMDSVKTEIEAYPVTEEEKALWKKDLDEKTKEKWSTVVTRGNHNYSYGSNYWGNKKRKKKKCNPSVAKDTVKRYGIVKAKYNELLAEHREKSYEKERWDKLQDMKAELEEIADDISTFYSLDILKEEEIPKDIFVDDIEDDSYGYRGYNY